jgi:hypothetical protein
MPDLPENRDPPACRYQWFLRASMSSPLFMLELPSIPISLARSCRSVFDHRSTRFERIAGLGGLQRGMTNIEAVVRRSDGRWIAREVERSGGGGEHGGDDDDGGGRGRG